MTFNLMDLSKEKMQRLVKFASMRPCADDAEQNFLAYNWNKPNCFSQKQLNEFNSLINDFAKEIGNKFSGFYNDQYEVTVNNIDLFYARDIISQLRETENGNYFLSFSDNNLNAGGLVCMPHATALFLAIQMLGEHGQEDNTRPLSELEESLLVDIATVVVSALPGIHESLCFNASDKMVFDQMPYALDEQDEIFKVNLSLCKGESEDKFDMEVMIMCNAMGAMSGKEVDDSKQLSPDAAVKAIMAHLNRTEVDITARFASIKLSINEAMDLQKGDFILLDKNINEPIELILEDKTIFKGICAKTDNSYAIKVTERCDDKQVK